jgi:hypothetical protein
MGGEGGDVVGLMSRLHPRGAAPGRVDVRDRLLAREQVHAVAIHLAEALRVS